VGFLGVKLDSYRAAMAGGDEFHFVPLLFRGRVYFNT
jgi:hypothetical protein